MRKIIRQVGKGSQQELLPNRAVLNQLTKGEPWQRAINNYAKVTPGIEGAEQVPSVLEMAQVKY